MDEGSEESIVQRPNGQVRSFRWQPSRPSFSTGPWSSCIVTGHDQSMHCPLFSRPSQMQCMQCAVECNQATARAVCRKCFTSIAIDRARRSSPVVRSCQRSIASVSTASKRRHLLEVLPWLNFIPDTQQVQAERFSFLLGVTCALAPGTWRSTAL